MTWNEQSEFAALFNASTPPPPRLKLQTGDWVKGAIIHLSKDTAFVQLDARNEAMIPLSELEEPSVGQVVEATVSSMDDQIWLTTKSKKGSFSTSALVQGKVTAVNSGGVEVDVDGQKAFCPMGQLDLNYIQDPSVFVGQTLSFAVTQSTGKQLTLSRKILLQKERSEKSREALSTLKIGDRLEGTVARLEKYGAFVSLSAGLDGLVHISELSLKRIRHPEEVVKVGDQVTVRILEIDPATKKVSLSLKEEAPTPEAVEAQPEPKPKTSKNSLGTLGDLMRNSA